MSGEKRKLFNVEGLEGLAFSSTELGKGGKNPERSPGRACNGDEMKSSLGRLKPSTKEMKIQQECEEFNH